MRGSLFRASYEQLFTPVAARDKRAAKSIIDVAFDRAGDAVGGALILLVGMAVLPAARPAALVGLAMVLSAVTLVVARRLQRGYIGSLERSLARQAIELDLHDVIDRTTRETLTQFLPARSRTIALGQTERHGTTIDVSDPVLAALAALRSRDVTRVTRVLRSPEGIPGELVPYVIPLLAWDAVSNDAIVALRKVADRHVGMMIDTLLDDDGTPFATRRRLARVFSACSSQRAADGLVLGLDDLRFEVRFQCGRSIAAILNRNPSVKVDRDRVFAVVLREVAAGQEVWQSHRLLDAPDARDETSFVDEVLHTRAGQSLAHVFTLLMLTLPRDPLQVAFRGLHTADVKLRGTALEYLDSVLPRAIRDGLWPFLEDPGPAPRVRGKVEEPS